MTLSPPSRSSNATSDLAERYARVLPSFVKPMYAEPMSIDHGRGSYVWDIEGNRYLDFFGGVLRVARWAVPHNGPHDPFSRGGFGHRISRILRSAC